MRPKLTERITLRIPEELLIVLHQDATRRRTSVNEVALSAMENDLARLLTYRLDFYADLLPLAAKLQGDTVRQLCENRGNNLNV